MVQVHAAGQWVRAGASGAAVTRRNHVAGAGRRTNANPRQVVPPSCGRPLGRCCFQLGLERAQLECEEGVVQSQTPPGGCLSPGSVTSWVEIYLRAVCLHVSFGNKHVPRPLPSYPLPSYPSDCIQVGGTGV
jgi:hypothetical protein